MGFVKGARVALAAAWLTLAVHGAAHAVVTSTDPANWRVLPGDFGGAFDGVAQLSIQLDNGNLDVCSGSLLAGGRYVLTAAHCVDHAVDTDLSFRSGDFTAKASQVILHPGWSGTLGTGADIAVLKLDRFIPLPGAVLSTSNDLGKDILIIGHGSTGLGNLGRDSAADPVSAPHYGFNTFEAFDFDLAEAFFGAGAGNRTYGETYIADFDDGSNLHNALLRLKTVYGGAWADSSLGLGAAEGLSAGGDSGGGDFVWDGTQWRLSGVQSYVWAACNVLTDCIAGGESSYGYLSGSTAVFSHTAWIASVTPVPEPKGWTLMLAGAFAVGLVLRRRMRRDRD